MQNDQVVCDVTVPKDGTKSILLGSFHLFRIFGYSVFTLGTLSTRHDHSPLELLLVLHSDGIDV